ncbi:MAG: ABC transporter permease subunit [Crocinitomicaceae bacterium]|nr:ABC transporter permease subunit [Crocinitomicaceae bacterium]
MVTLHTLSVDVLKVNLIFDLILIGYNSLAQMRALYFKEIRSFLGSIIGYIFILIFLILSGSFHWIISMDTNLLEGLEADLIPFFNLSPWFFLFLIPAITMRSIAEERRTGTIELLFTRPISDIKIILAKYFASVTLLIIALLPTLIYYASMHYLGSPVGIIDDGATMTSYLGLILIGASFVAIGIFASAITSSQIVAFIIAMFLSILFYQGFELIGSYNQIGSFDSVIKYCGMTYHYDGIKRGLIDTKNIVYFITIIVLFIFAALTVLKSLKK